MNLILKPIQNFSEKKQKIELNDIFLKSILRGHTPNTNFIL
jgi:hypothetical protein